MAAPAVHVHWGVSLSLALHVGALGALGWVLPRVNVRPGVTHRVELSIVHEAPKAAPLPAPVSPAPASTRTAASQPSQPSAATEADAEHAPDHLATRKAHPRPRKLQRTATRATAAQPPTTTSDDIRIRSATHADPRSDGSALERVLRKIAATRELTPDQRRKAMLVVLRTWEDPSGGRDAQQLIDALLAELPANRRLDPTGAGAR